MTSRQWSLKNFYILEFPTTFGDAQGRAKAEQAEEVIKCRVVQFIITAVNTANTPIRLDD